MSQIRKVGKFTYWCSICEKYLLNDTAEEHVKMHHKPIHQTGLFTHWCDICNKELVADTAHPDDKVVQQHIRLHHMTGIEKHWLEEEQGDLGYDAWLMKRMGVRWP